MLTLTAHANLGQSAGVYQAGSILMGPTDKQRAVQTRCVKENSEDVECEILGGKRKHSDWLN